FVAEISGYGPEVIPVIGCRGSCACPSRIAGGQVAVAIGFLMQLHGRFEVMRLSSCLPVGLKSLLYTGDGKDPLAVGGAFTSVVNAADPHIVLIAERNSGEVAITFIEYFIANISVHIGGRDYRGDLPPPVALKIRGVYFGGKTQGRTNQPFVDDVHTVTTHVEIFGIKRLLLRIDFKGEGCQCG